LAAAANDNLCSFSNFRGETPLRNHTFLSVALAAIWLKAYLVQRFAFNLPVTGWDQEMIMLIHPIAPILLLALFALLLFRQGFRLALILVSLLTSLLLFADMVFYRFFNDFITIPVLLQTDNMSDLWNSIAFLLQPADALLFTDALGLTLLALRGWSTPFPVDKLKLAAAFTAVVTMLTMNYSMAENVRPELLTRAFDRQILVKSIGAFNYHLYDAVINARMGTKKALAKSTDYASVNQYFMGQTPDGTDPRMYGIAKGRNVFLISLESLQTFVLERRIDGQEITPYLNRLAKESFTFDNVYHQTGQGKTSDAEFMIDTSLYPLPTGAVYFTHAQNTYHSMPKLLTKHGYYSAAFHANDPSFWNRRQMYPTMGYDRFYSVRDYSVTSEHSIGWGLDDASFFEQSIELVKELPQPFYSKFITLTNHYPFVLDEKRRLIPEFTSRSKTLNRYIPTVRYMDQAVEHFFAKVKAAGLYENSIFVLYGDHYGISEKHNKAMAQLLGKERLTPFDVVQLQRVPLIIHIPGTEGRRMNTVGGQIDFKPTLLHLLGVELDHPHYFGRDLFAPDRRGLAIFRDGGFATERWVYTKNACYDKSTGEKTDMLYCQRDKELAAEQLVYSDSIIYGDLLRFSLDAFKEM
jgi:lipoteichoic acid synthase